MMIVGRLVSSAGVGNHSMLNTFQLILLEHIAMCRLVMGNRTLAIKEVCTFPPYLEALRIIPSLLSP